MFLLSSRHAARQTRTATIDGSSKIILPRRHPARFTSFIILLDQLDAIVVADDRKHSRSINSAVASIFFRSFLSIPSRLSNAIADVHVDGPVRDGGLSLHRVINRMLDEKQVSSEQ